MKAILEPQQMALTEARLLQHDLPLPGYAKFYLWHKSGLPCHKTARNKTGREEHSMDQCRSRLKLSENFEHHWSILILGETHMDQSLVHTFSWGNSYGPMVLKVLLKFLPTLALVHGWLFPDGAKLGRCLSTVRPVFPVLVFQISKQLNRTRKTSSTVLGTPPNRTWTKRFPLVLGRALRRLLCWSGSQLGIHQTFGLSPVGTVHDTVLGYLLSNTQSDRSRQNATFLNNCW